MRILLVHADQFPWATTQRAKTFKKLWAKDKVDISYFKNLPNGDNYDVIHFLFSGAIGRSKDYILKYKDKVFTTLASERTLDEHYDKLPTLIKIYQNTVCCVAQNPTLAEKLRKIIKQNNIVYIPNGVDEQLFNRNFIVGFVGADMDSSDHKGLKLIRQACDDLDLELKLAHIASMNDLRPHTKMPAYYKSIDCLVLASRSEGCNNPTLEALASNIPVISTDVGIARELEGVTLVERDVASIKQALRKLSGRIQILEGYTWKKVAEKYRNLYIENGKKKF